MLKTHALSFKRQTYLFEDLNLHIEAGTFVEVSGPNGAGKTTLLRILAGFLTPFSGEIYYQGNRISETEPTYRNAIGYLGHTNAIKPTLTISENILSHATLMGIEITEINTVLQEFNLHFMNKRLAYQLSMGQQRKIALINLILSKKAIWLLDEPTTSLDKASSEQIKKAIARHVQEGGIAIAATHQTLGLNLPSSQHLRL
jgi:heme exporter protein A